jgi:RNA polymerase sigma factor (sigma-70 family)
MPSVPLGQGEAASAERARWFAQEVQSHEAEVRGYLRSQFPSLDADDVLQESYLKLLRTRAAGQIKSTRAYFFSVARNTAFTLFRRARLYSETSAAGRAELSALDPAPDAAESADSHRRIALAVEAIDRLPGRCREIVQRVAFRGMSAAEIGAELGLSPATVRVQMARGIKKCAAYLAERQDLP